MIIDRLWQEEREIIFSYLPVWEMFFSMHVLSNPEHHNSRRKWAAEKERAFPGLTGEIRELRELTDSWILIIDSEKWEEIRQMEIDGMIAFFRKMNIYQWNEWVKCPEGKPMSIAERDRILDVTEEYYHTVFRREETILRPYLLRVLKDEEEKCRREGIWNWCGRLHARLHVEEDQVTFLKNREYQVKKEEIQKIFVTASTFLSPHLWMYRGEHSLELVKSVATERLDQQIPQDFARILKAMGEERRLQIIRYLLQGVCTTQALAQEIGISEAAVSKHMKILQEAGLVRKRKRGFYVEYEFKTEVVDYFPYTFYETMLQ